jgi:hypothetical protein
VVDAVSPCGVVGWLADAAGDLATLSDKVYINGHWQGQCFADLQCPDLVKAGVVAQRSRRLPRPFRSVAATPQRHPRAALRQLDGAGTGHPCRHLSA